MSSSRTIKKEERDVEKEEQFLIREIRFLESFQEDLQEIFSLQERIKEFNEAAKGHQITDLSKKLQLLQELVKRDENKFKKLRRLLGKSERRRIRYEQRVLGRIKEVELNVDNIVKNDLDNLLEQVQIYSARVLTELSWRVGKITELTSNKNPDLVLIKKHLEATVESSKALLSLLERLQQFMKTIENKIDTKKLIQPILPQIIGLTGYFREGAIKTAIIKSIVPLKYFLEKGLTAKEEMRQKYYQLIEQYQPELRKGLSEDEIRSLKGIRYPVPEKATLLFIPLFSPPILAFNIHTLPDFSSAGWITTAVPGENLIMVSKSGLLVAPLEQVFSKKRYFTDKNTDLGKRLTDGISFTFQEYKKYQAYMQGGFIPGKATLIGGLFIFPMRNVFAPGLILDFADTIDLWPEIVLRDETYLGKKAYLIAELLGSINAYRAWLARYTEIKKFFKEAKQNLDFIQKLIEALPNYKVFMWTIKQEGKILFAVEFKPPHYLEEKNIVDARLGKEFLQKSRKAYEEDKDSEESKEMWNRRLQEINIFHAEHYHKEAQFVGEGFFYEKLAETYLRKDYLEMMVKFLIENDFFKFSLIAAYKDVGISWSDEDLTPPLVRYSAAEAPKAFNGTILNPGVLDYLRLEKVVGNTLPGVCLTLTLMADKPNLFHSLGTYTPQNYLEYIKKFSPHAVRKLFSKAHAGVIKALEAIVERKYRTSQPCIIPANKGILLVNQANQNLEIIERLADRGCTIFSQFRRRGNGGFDNEQLDFFMSKVLPLHNLSGGLGFFESKSFFYLKNGKLIAHQRLKRSGNKEFVIG